MPHMSLVSPDTVQEVTAAWQDGIDALRGEGVTGRIMLANIPSPRGIPVSVLGPRHAFPELGSRKMPSLCRITCFRTGVVGDVP